MSTQIELSNYSERAIAVFGDTKMYKEAFTKIGGKYNPSLKYGEGRSAGWVFSKTKRDLVETLLHDISTGKVKKDSPSKAAPMTKDGAGSIPVDAIDRKTFLALVSRVERLEQELTLIKKSKQSVTVKKPVQANVTFSGGSDDDGDDSEDEEEVEYSAPMPRLMPRKK